MMVEYDIGINYPLTQSFAVTFEAAKLEVEIKSISKTRCL